MWEHIPALYCSTYGRFVFEDWLHIFIVSRQTLFFVGSWKKNKFLQLEHPFTTPWNMAMWNEQFTWGTCTCRLAAAFFMNSVDFNASQETSQGSRSAIKGVFGNLGVPLKYRRIFKYISNIFMNEWMLKCFWHMIWGRHLFWAPENLAIGPPLGRDWANTHSCTHCICTSTTRFQTRKVLDIASRNAWN